MLTGGGARAAYQVGALRALAEQTCACCPFGVIAGASAGAINGTAIAGTADDFAGGAARLEATWRAIAPDSIYATDVPRLAEIGADWLRQLAGGGHLGGHANALLDTAPLRALLGDALPLARIPELIAAGHLRGVAVTATSYDTGAAVTFFDGVPELEPWQRTGRIARRATLTVDHVLASAAIPVFFPPIHVDGAPYADGCVRLTAPLSPAIRMGAQRIIGIGIHEVTPPTVPVPADPPHSPTPAEIAGVLLDAVFLDSLEADAERLIRINTTLAAMTPAQRRTLSLRPIPLLVLQPSLDLGRLAVEQYHQMPWALRYLLAGIGADGQRGWDLLSYLAFVPVYIDRLIDLGYRDTTARRDEIARFLDGDAAPAARAG